LWGKKRLRTFGDCGRLRRTCMIQVQTGNETLPVVT
jgi:hypothetical protein